MKVPARFRGYEWVGENAAVLAFFAVATAILIGNVVLTGSITCDVGFDDRLFDTRLMRWETDWLLGRGGGRGLFDIDFFFPHANALATTDPEFGLVLITLPVRLFTDDYLLLTNLAAYLSFVLSGHAMYLLAKELLSSRGAALFGAVAFSFCQYRFHQIDHSQILQMQWLLYAFYCLHRLSKEPKLKWAIPVGLFVWLHGVSSLSAAILSLPMLPFVALAAVAMAAPKDRLRVLGFAAAAGAIAGVCLYPFYRPLLINREAYNIVRDLNEVRVYSGHVEQLWATPAYNRVYGPERAADMGRESLTFPGYALLFFMALGVGMRWRGSGAITPRARLQDFALECVIAFGRAVAFAAMVYAATRWSILWWIYALAFFALFLQRRLSRPELPREPRELTAIRLYAALGVMFLLASFGPEIIFRGQQIGAGVWDWVTKFPGYAQVRTPSRFYWVTMVGMTLAGAAGLKLVLEQLPWVTPRRVVAIAAVSVVLYEMAVKIPERKMITLDQAPRVYYWLKDQPGKGAIAELPYFNEGPERYRMFFANIHKRPTVNAESSFALPALTWIRAQSLLSQEGPVNLERLKVAGLEYFIVHTREMPPNYTEAHRAVLTNAGAVRVQSIDGDEVWQFQSHPEAKAFSSEFFDTRIQLPASVSASAPFTAYVQLTSNAPVYERAHRKLQLKLTGMPLHEGKDTFKVHVAPPLFLAGKPIAFPVTITAGTTRGAHTVHAELVDEQGKQWASADGTIDVR